MSFDKSGYILYPRASQTQQVPAYDFQISIPGWRSSVPKYPSLPNDTRSQAVCRGVPLALRLWGTVRTGRQLLPNPVVIAQVQPIT